MNLEPIYESYLKKLVANIESMRKIACESLNYAEEKSKMWFDKKDDEKQFAVDELPLQNETAKTFGNQ